MHAPGPDRDSFIRKVLLVAVVATAAVALVLFLRAVLGVLLIFFAGVLLAVALDGGSRLLSRHTFLSRRWSLLVVCLAVVGLFLAFGWLIGPQVGEQLAQLGESLRQAVEQIRGRISESPVAQALLENLPAADKAMNGGDLLTRVTGFFSTLLGAFANAAVILFLGIYLAFNPSLYSASVISLLPHARRRRGREVIAVLGRALRRWLLGRLVSMATVGVLTAAGLTLIGMPLAVPLGLIAAFLSFIPYLGPLLSAVPAILIGFADGPQMALYVVLVYTVVQTLESYLIDPIVERKAVYIPPAYQITAQLMATLTAGFMGILLATPLVVVATVLVQMLYLQDVLGDSPKIAGEDQADS